MQIQNWNLAKACICMGVVISAMPAYAESLADDEGQGRDQTEQEVSSAACGPHQPIRQSSGMAVQATSSEHSTPDFDAEGTVREGDPWLFERLFNAYRDEFRKTSTVAKSTPESARRGLPSPWDAPPFPMSEYQGVPRIGVPLQTKEYPLTKALYGGMFGDVLKTNRIRVYGWVNGSYNWSTNNNSNMPTSYWIVPNSVILNQTVFRVEREVDTVQTDHIDFGFRATALYGYDYRYMAAGGWFDSQLIRRNQRTGFDPTELYLDTYIPGVAQGLVLRVGRWVGTPDIETQFAPDNYLGSHSLLFTVDTYTQTGALATLMLNQQWMLQAGIHAGTDMAPWYQGATPTGIVGVRWVSLDNDDSAYVVLNAINDAKFRDFELDGQPAGHTNFNYAVGTWQHRFTRKIHTKLEGYYMWERNAPVGGTPIIGPVRSFGGGGGRGPIVPGTSLAYGVVNYTMIQVSQRDYVTLRNEWWRDETGFRSGFAGHYSSHTLGWSHQFNDVVMIRPEVGYYRNYDRGAFDLGVEQDMVMAGVDMTLRF